MSELKKPEKKELPNRITFDQFDKLPIDRSYCRDMGFNQCWDLFNAYHEQGIMDLKNKLQELKAKCEALSDCCLALDCAIQEYKKGD